MEDKKLIIDGNTKLRKIKNRDEITKLELGIEVSNRFLSSFPNIKDLTINSYVSVANNFNERNLEQMPFMENLEKIKFRNIWNLGRYEKGAKTTLTYSLLAPKLKSIELPSNIMYMSKQYLDNCHLLEKIILNIGSSGKDIRLFVNNTNLNEIILNCEGNTYNIKPDYKVYSIENYGCYDGEHYRFVYFKNKIFSTKAVIRDKEVYKENILNVLSKELLKDNSFYIPDFIDRIELYDYDHIAADSVKEISINAKILSTSNGANVCVNPGCLEKVILRNDNDMKLFKEKEISLKEYSGATHVSIKDNKLNITYGENFNILIDEDGNVEKVLNKEKLEKEEKLHELDKYTTKELMDYLCCKRFLELMKELELDNRDKETILDIKDKLIKKLIK